MERYAIDSSTIGGVAYDPATLTLEVHFLHRGAYRYFEVPEFVLRALLKAESKGEYFNRCIAGRFRFEEIR